MAKKKILIVDYDEKSLDALVRLFKPHNLHIITATDGVSAYEKFISEKPDLVILEAILPKLHGFDLTKRISQESKGNVPVVIVTGLYRGPQYKREALSSFGASDYFEKPFDKNRLVNSVLNFLKEEAEIKEDLPDPGTVIESLLARLARSNSPASPTSGEDVN